MVSGPRKLDLGKDPTPTPDCHSNSIVKVFQLNGHKSKNCNINIDLATKQFNNCIFAVQEPYCNMSGGLEDIGNHIRKIRMEKSVASFKYANCKEKVRSAILASNHLNAIFP